MSKIKLCLAAAFFLTATLAQAQERRKAVWAGAFYEENPHRLSAQVDLFLKNAGDIPSLAGEVAALICPHAGYVYSGQTAAYAYRLIQGKPYETVVIIGPSHRHGFD
ncbi:MAG: AmmeMemoRadiSam system protein B, partial [Candidatus Aminicenantes bacterium]|nr:AmmeMemoRadiSam system protein B [Candidatus Aminicenantes bacterium]